MHQFGWYFEFRDQLFPVKHSGDRKLINILLHGKPYKKPIFIFFKEHYTIFEIHEDRVLDTPEIIVLKISHHQVESLKNNAETRSQ